MDEKFLGQYALILTLFFMFMFLANKKMAVEPVVVDKCAERIPLSFYHHEDDKRVYCVYDEQLWQYDKEQL